MSKVQFESLKDAELVRGILENSLKVNQQAAAVMTRLGFTWNTHQMQDVRDVQVHILDMLLSVTDDMLRLHNKGKCEGCSHHDTEAYGNNVDEYNMRLIQIRQPIRYQTDDFYRRGCVAPPEIDPETVRAELAKEF